MFAIEDAIKEIFAEKPFAFLDHTGGTSYFIRTPKIDGDQLKKLSELSEISDVKIECSTEPDKLLICITL